MLNYNYDDIFSTSKKVEKEKKAKDFVEKVETEVLEQKEVAKEKKVEKNQEIVQEKKNEISTQTQKTTQVATQKPNTLVGRFLEQVVNYAETSGENLDQKTKSLAVDIITATNKHLVASQVNWSEVDVQGCGLVSQIKRFAKLGLSMEDKLYPDVRNNSKTGKKDIHIKPQYQALEKLMVRFFSKPILRFKEDIVCIGDEVLEEEDFYTGLNRIVGHKRNFSIDRNKLDNIIGAYKIAYVQEGKNIVQYVIRIDKNRITRAYNASPSREKTVWNLDSKKMVLKTVTWEMWNDKNIRAFMVFPEDIAQDLSILEESQEMDWNAETKFQRVEQAQEQVQVDVATGEVVEMSYDEL